MKKITFLLTTVFALTVSSCTGSFEETNTDPNRIEEISPGTLLNPIIYGLASHNADRAYNITFNLMQVSLPYPSISGGLHRYDVINGIGNSSWNAYYKWAKNIKEMESASDRFEDENYKAIALTLKAWVYSNLTDLFGPIPMQEAAMGDENIIYPTFDSQQQVYQTILSDLEKANNLYKTSKSMIYMNDILFTNDVTKWKKFTNSLRLRLLLRTSNALPENFSKMADIINNPATYPVFTNTAESAILQVTGVEPNVSPWGRPQDFRLGKKMASFFIDNLNTWNDPRRAIIASTGKNAAGKNIGYIGIPSAYEGSDSQFTYDASTFNLAPISNPMKIYILPYSEVEFIKAELAQKGYIPDAETHYNKGINAAIEQLGAITPSNYFDNTNVKYNGTLEQIMLQKYYALYFADYQQWFEYRRTGFPVLPTTGAMSNNAKMPIRLLYPNTLITENKTGYETGLELLGGSDSINTAVWWDAQ